MGFTMASKVSTFQWLSSVRAVDACLNTLLYHPCNSVGAQNVLPELLLLQQLEGSQRRAWVSETGPLSSRGIKQP